MSENKCLSVQGQPSLKDTSHANANQTTFASRNDSKYSNLHPYLVLNPGLHQELSTIPNRKDVRDSTLQRTNPLRSLKNTATYGKKKSVLCNTRRASDLFDSVVADRRKAVNRGRRRVRFSEPLVSYAHETQLSPGIPNSRRKGLYKPSRYVVSAPFEETASCQLYTYMCFHVVASLLTQTSHSRKSLATVIYISTKTSKTSTKQ